MTKTSSPLESCKSTKKDPAIQQASSSQQAQSSKTNKDQDSKPELSSQNKKHEDSSRTSQDTERHPVNSLTAQTAWRELNYQEESKWRELQDQ